MEIKIKTEETMINKSEDLIKFADFANHTVVNCRKQYAPENQNQYPQVNYCPRPIFPQANYVCTQRPTSPYGTQPWFPNTAANYHITFHVPQFTDVQD